MSVATGQTFLEWDEEAADLATAQGYTYTAVVDALQPVALAVTCAEKNPPVEGVFDCTAPFPAVTPGPHTITVIASNAAGASQPSLPFSFTFLVVPATPTNVRLK